MSQEQIAAVKDLLKLADHMGRTPYFYLTESLENDSFSPDPTCPEIIRRSILGFLSGNAFTDMKCGSGRHYIISFGIHFLLFHLPDRNGYCVMGPLRYKRPTRTEIENYIKKYRLDHHNYYVLNSYLTSITDEHASGEPFQYIFTHIYRNPVSSASALERIYLEDMPDENISVEPPVSSGMHDVDQKYEREMELRNLIGQGKRRDAGILLEQRDRTQYFRHSELNSMLRLLSLNITCKQALAEAKIPAIYIEKLYASYIRDIATDINNIMKNESMISARMLDDYCKLARDYSTQGCSRQVKKAMNYVLMNYTEKITIQSIAEYLEITPNYLSSVFKKETGSSLTSWINGVRINSSLSLLANTSLPISEIADRVGIPDYNYFSRVFQKQMGISPSQYRKDYQMLAESMYAGHQT